MRKIAIMNQKGGSGKTTTAVNLAATLAEKKRKVLVIDIDPQGSTTSWFGLSTDDKALYSVFTENVHLGDIVQQADVENIDVVQSSTWLIGLEKMLAHEVGAETILKEHIKSVAHKKYDYVLVDCPPTLGLLTVNALCAVDEVMVPVEARFMALSGLVQLMQTVDVIKKRLNKGLRIAGIVPCRVDGRTRHASEVVDALQTNFKGMLYKTAIRENVRLSEASLHTKPITQYDKHSNGAYDYRALAREVIKQEEK